MNKKFTKLIAALALLVFMAPSMVGWGQTRTVSNLTFTAACNGSGTANDGAVWTVTSDGTESNFDSNKGIHYGTSSAAVQYITLTTSDISGTITKVVVNASTASGVTATVGVTVGGSAFGGNPQSTSTNPTDYTFNGSASGEIIVTHTKPSSATKALYVKSVVVTYTTGGSQPTTYTVTFDAGEGTFVGNTAFPNASNTVEAGTYTLPSANRDGYTFDGWTITGDANLYTGSYEVSDDVDFTAHYTENTPPTPGGDLNLTFDVSSNPGGWPTANSTTLTNYTYTLNSVDYTFALKNVKCNSGYLMMTQVAVLGLPAIEGYKLTKVVASNSSGCSTSTKVGISSSDSQASYIAGGEIQTWGTTSSQYTYTLTSTNANTMYYMYVTNKNAQVIELTLTYAQVSTSEPSISGTAPAELAYDATSGQIGYTITNEVTGGTVSASVPSGSWITVPNTISSSPFTFTCSANPNAAQRSETVTLTYTYNTDQTKTTTVTVTQAGNPNIVDNISDITAAGNYTVRGTIVAKSTRGFVLGDGTGYIYYYKGSTVDQNVGDIVKISGAVSASSSYKVFQFTSTAEITTATESNYTAEVPTVLSGADMDAVVTGSNVLLSSYVQYQGTLTVNGTYYNITSIDGATTAKGSISYPTNTEFTSLNGKVVTVTGYYAGVSSDQYYNTMIGSIEEVAQAVEAPTFSPVAGTYASAQNVAISCETPSTVIHYTLDGTEPTDASTSYSGPISVSTTTTIKAVAYAGGSDHSTVATANYYFCSADDPYTVTEALTFESYQYPANGIYVNGIVSTAPTAAPNSNGELTYYISVDGDATNQLEVYKGKGLNEAAFTAQDDIQVGDIVTIFGNVVVYNNTTIEFAAGNYLVYFERPSAPVVPSVTVTPSTINAPFDGEDGTIAITYENIPDLTDFDYHFCDAEGNELLDTDPAYPGDWIYAEINEDNGAYSLDYIIDANGGDARTAYLYVFYEEYYAIVTVNQAAYVAPPTPGNNYVKVTSTSDLTDGQYLIVYEDGGLAFDGSLTTLDAANNTIEVTISNNEIAITSATAASEFTIAAITDGYSIQSASGYYIGQTSDANGMKTSETEEYSNTISIDVDGNADILASGGAYLRYNATSGQERFRYFKSSTYTGQKAIQLYKKVVDPDAPSIIVTPNSIAAESAGTSGTLGITIANMTITDVENQMSADFFTSTGEPISGGKPDWIEFEFHLNGDAYSATYTIADNTTTSERNAYFKVYGLDDDGDTDAYSNLVSVTQEAYVAPVAAITLDSYAIDATASETNGALTVTLENLTVSDVDQFSIDFFHQDGSDFNPGEQKPDWVHAEFTLVNNVYSMNYTVDANTETTERNAYFKVYGLDDDGTTDAYSELVTVTQAGATGPVTTGTIVFGNNGTKINATEVTGDDSMGNTWTITTVFGEAGQSFTQNAAYSQVGANGKPATSITFTTTLPQATTITAFEAKFGGFSGTAGDINLLVGETNVGTGTLDAGNDVTVTNTTTATGTTLTVTVTNIAKGVKCYYISYTVSTSTDPMINAPASIDLASDATSGEIEYSIINPATGVNLTAASTDSWISNIAVANDKVTFTTTANTETTERQGTITLSYAGATDKEVTVIQAAYVPPVVGQQFALFGGNLVEGDYIIYFNGKAMNNVVSSGRLQYAEIEPEDNVITTDNAAIVWHIAPNDEGYWTIHSADANAYAASTGVKNKAQLLDDGTDDMAMWTVTEISGTYEFVNKANAAGDVNANLRNNGTYGFACYANTTGGALSLYKYTEQTVATYTKEIVGYGTSTNGGYYLIASPILAVAPAADNGFLTDAYDLYYFDQNEEKEWRNYEATPFNLVAGKGYLYASQENTTLSFNGVPYAGNGLVELDYTDGATFAGWNLIGNPFATAATLNMPFYKINAAGDGFTPKIEDLSNTISAMEGVFVQATAANQTATFTPQTSKGGRQSGIAKANLNIIGANGKVIDNAIVRFDEGQTLEKFMLHADGTKIFFTEGNKDYAIVRSNGQGETPVSFKAAENGTYTIDFSMDNVEFNYLHLIDNKTGNDIDLLATPSYSFEARTTDYASRFRLMFSANANTTENGNETFAYYNGSEWVIANEGDATLQVVDMMGRVLHSETVNGSANINVNAAAGVYVLRLINGENVKTQKIVVR